MGIDLRQNGHDLESDDLYLAERAASEAMQGIARPRIGVAYAGAWAGKPLRYYIAGSDFVSKP